jgi:hypothetical protein
MAAFSNVIVLTMILLGASCESIQTRSDYDRAADFAAYRTFSWISETSRIPRN